MITYLALLAVLGLTLLERTANRLAEKPALKNHFWFVALRLLGIGIIWVIITYQIVPVLALLLTVGVGICLEKFLAPKILPRLGFLIPLSNGNK